MIIYFVLLTYVFNLINCFGCIKMSDIHLLFLKIWSNRYISFGLWMFCCFIVGIVVLFVVLLFGEIYWIYCLGFMCLLSFVLILKSYRQINYKKYMFPLAKMFRFGTGGIYFQSYHIRMFAIYLRLA